MKTAKRNEAALTDQRLKYVNDMVVGARTIKCYGWESHYLKKVKETRQKQLKWLFLTNFIRSLGLALFGNMGLVAIFIIFMLRWSRCELLDLSNSFSLLALIFYTFVSNGQMTWMGIVNASLFLAIIERMGKVLKMEEKATNNNADPPADDGGSQIRLQFEKASFTWGFRFKEHKDGVLSGANDQRGGALIEINDKSVVDDLTLTMREGQLLVVIGSVGAGKTTFLHAVLGEINRKSGSQYVNGTLAYVE